jgi:hypothetical protein
MSESSYHLKQLPKLTTDDRRNVRSTFRITVVRGSQVAGGRLSQGAVARGAAMP